MFVYFLGICGTAMGNAALLLKAKGYRVEGADQNVYPPMSDVLRMAGIEILEGFSRERLERLAPDLVVIGNTTVRGNPEFEWLLADKKIPFVSLPALLHNEFLARRRNIVVTGTHGKTTTSTLAAVLLRANGAAPGFFIGGVPRDLETGAAAGADDAPFVIEGDEYDTALFDKRSKFIHYAPHIALVNNLEFDHADIFRDLADVRRSFNHFLKIVPGNGFILLNGDDSGVASLDPCPWAPVLRVGTGANCDLRIERFEEGSEGASFDLVWKGKPWTTVRWHLGGVYNARNAAMAALAAGLALWPEDPTRLSLEALARYQGVRRRQECLVDRAGLAVVEDFGHHPTAIGEILRSLRSRYAGRKLTAVFQPCTNTTRRNVLQAELVEALARGDEVYLGPIDRPEKVPAGERLDLEAVVAQLQTRGGQARHFPSNAELLKTLIEATLGGSRNEERVVVFFTNGAFDGIIAKYAGEAMARLPQGQES